MKLGSCVCASLVLWAGYVESAFSQTLRLEGRFEFRTDEESKDVLGDQVCFFPDHLTARLVPREKSDRRLVWFCFANTADAKRMLNISSSLPSKNCGYAGNATVAVTGYKVYLGEGDGNDVAVLVNVTSLSKSESIKCAQ